MLHATETKGKETDLLAFIKIDSLHVPFYANLHAELIHANMLKISVMLMVQYSAVKGFGCNEENNQAFYV